MCAFFSRGPNKIQNAYVLGDMYASYIEDKEEYSPYAVSYDEFLSITREYLKMVMSSIINEARTYKLPFRLGSIRVVKLDSSLGRKRRYSLDFSLTHKYGKPIYHLNEHSGGYKYMFKWDKINAYVKHKFYYRFIPTRANKRMLAYNIKNYITDYFEI